jgi:tRNA(Arg) A34 adenosine deaminase TadA
MASTDNWKLKMSDDSTREGFMREAIRLSVENVKSGSGGPFGAIVVKDGKIVARGTNQVTATNDPTAHAEVVAIREACSALKSFQLDGCDLYASCEPCPMCLGAIYWARPDRVFFAAAKSDASEAGFDDSFIYNELPRPFAQRKIPMTQFMRDVAKEAFEAWKKLEKKVQY